MKNKSFLTVLFPLYFSLLAGGCAESKYVPVSGTVTVDGKPKAKIVVRFQPTGGTLSSPSVGRGSYGTSDENGNFTLQVSSKQSGAAKGQHRVSFTTAGAGRIEPIPKKYNVDSKETYEVPPEGTANADFDLKMNE